MAKIMMLLPKAHMIDYAETVIQENNFEIKKVKQIETANAVEEARECINEGANIIIARGVQARLIKQYTSVSVAEITITAQEIGLLMLECKKIVDKERPQIAIISISNMIDDVSYFDQLFDVNLKTYLTDNIEAFDQAVENAVNDGADIILGGENVIKIVENYNIPALFLRSTEDSLLEAIKLAKKMAYAIDREKSNTAQIETMLDTSFSGIIKIDFNHKIMIVNHIIEEILNKPASEIIGEQLEDIISNIDYSSIESLLNGDIDNYSTTVNIMGNPLFFMIAPIQYDKEIKGAILTCSRIRSRIKNEHDNNQDMYLQGNIAKYNFSSLKTKAPQMKECIELGKKYAISNSPVLIYGEDGTEKEILAECIHNNSERKSLPFYSISCSSINDIDQYEYLFGKYDTSEDEASPSGVFHRSSLGTVYINDIENLKAPSQYELYKIISSEGFQLDDNIEAKKKDIRIIVGNNSDLTSLVKNGLFRKDLYYSLNALTLRIPPLKDRREDIEDLVRGYLKQFTKEYTTYLTITDDAIKELEDYQWDGNLIQLKNFCERLFLTTHKKNIDQGMVISLLDKLYPDIKKIDGKERVVIYKDPEAKEIVESLKKHNGSRKDVAEELGISTTTLWRRMNKYGISNDYNY